jgi:hypothetical protein
LPPIKITSDDGFHELIAALLIVAIADEHGISRDDDYKESADMHAYTARAFLEAAALSPELLQQITTHVQTTKQRRNVRRKAA